MICQVSNVQDIINSNYRIFCDFHTGDKEHFVKIKDDIFDICQCSLFYYDSQDSEVDRAELEFNISNSNLYLLIVSSNVIYDRTFDMTAFRLAMDSNVPVLPIVVENGLEFDFNEKFGNLQCISTCLELSDHTVVPYRKKLKDFLNQTFSLSFNAETIQNAFDTTIFLSYRKKDRHHAQRLLEILHSSDRLKNVAVWYDEFLVPGEDFNENIKSRLESCPLFVLMITPNILEEKNYIKIIEYPLAMSLGKPVIPAMAVPTDIQHLRTAYPSISQSIDVKDAEKLKEKILQALQENGIIITERGPERDFYIGFAFLKGLNVEKNSAAAIEMITRAAQQGVFEAKKAMVSIYKYGDGCPADTDMAVCWQRKVIQQLSDNFDKTPSEENAVLLAEACMELADIFRLAGDSFQETVAYLDIVTLFKNSCYRDTLFAKIHSAAAYEAAVLVNVREGNFTSVMRHGFIDKAIEMRCDVYESGIKQDAVVDLINAWLIKAKCQYETSDEAGLNTTINLHLREIKEQLLSFCTDSIDSQPLEILQKVTSCLCELGRYADYMWRESQIFVSEAVNLSRALNKKYNLYSTNCFLYTALKNNGAMNLNNSGENGHMLAEQSFAEAHTIALNLAEQSKTAESRLVVAESFLNLAVTYSSLKNKAAALENLNNALEIFENETVNPQSQPTKQKTYKAYYTAAKVYASVRDTEKAYEMLDKGFALNEEILEVSLIRTYALEMAEALKYKSQLFKAEWDFDSALECIRRRHLLITSRFGSPHRRLIAESYDMLISAYKRAGDFSKIDELKEEMQKWI